MNSFTLILDVPTDVDVFADENLEALCDAGCADASFGKIGDVHEAHFDREAQTFAAAVISAIEQIERSVPGVRVERIGEEELVDISDIAERTGRTRQSVWQLVKGQRGPGDFPRPGGSPGRSPFWHWADVARWFRERLGESGEWPQHADFVSTMNAVLEARNRARHLTRPERRAIARVLKREKQLVSA